MLSRHTPILFFSLIFILLPPCLAAAFSRAAAAIFRLIDAFFADFRA